MSTTKGANIGDALDVAMQDIDNALGSLAVEQTGKLPDARIEERWKMHRKYPEQMTAWAKQHGIDENAYVEDMQRRFR